MILVTAREAPRCYACDEAATGCRAVHRLAAVYVEPACPRHADPGSRLRFVCMYCQGPVRRGSLAYANEGDRVAELKPPRRSGVVVAVAGDMARVRLDGGRELWRHLDELGRDPAAAFDADIAKLRGAE